MASIPTVEKPVRHTQNQQIFPFKRSDLYLRLKKFFQEKKKWIFFTSAAFYIFKKHFVRYNKLSCYTGCKTFFGQKNGRSAVEAYFHAYDGKSRVLLLFQIRFILSFLFVDLLIINVL